MTGHPTLGVTDCNAVAADGKGGTKILSCCLPDGTELEQGCPHDVHVHQPQDVILHLGHEEFMAGRSSW